MTKVTDCEVQVVSTLQKTSVTTAPALKALVSLDTVEPYERDVVVFVADPEVDPHEATLLHFNLFDDEFVVTLWVDEHYVWHVETKVGEATMGADGVALHYCGDRARWRGDRESTERAPLFAEGRDSAYYGQWDREVLS